MSTESILRGELFFADLEPVRGCEQGGIRPVLVIQNDIGNRYSPTLIVAALTGKVYTKAGIPTHYLISKEIGLKMDSIVLMEQIRTIDRTRLVSYIGRLSNEQMEVVDEKIAISLGLRPAIYYL